MINNQTDQSLGKVAKDAKDKTGKFGADAADAIQTPLAQFGETAQKLTSDIGDRLSTTSRDVTAWTKDHPVKAALIGAGAGFVIGSVVRGMLKGKH